MQPLLHRAVRTVASLAFALSTLTVAVVTQAGSTGFDPDIMLLDGGIFAPRALTHPHHSLTDLIGAISQPTNFVLWSLLAAVLFAAVVDLGLRLYSRSPASNGLQIAGLLLAAAFPWLINTVPIVGLSLGAASCLLLVFSIAPRPVGQRGYGLWDLPIAFVAGWVLAASCSALGMYIHHRLGLGFERGVLLSLFVAALFGAWAQLRLESNVTYSLALIWAMIGFAAATAGASITIATACVLGIAALVVVLVRVTT